MALSELDMMNLWAKQLTDYKSQWERLFGFGYAVEAEVRNQAEARRDALEEAAAAVEKATYRKRWAKAAVNSHPDYVPPCEFAALIRAMKEPTP